VLSGVEKAQLDWLDEARCLMRVQSSRFIIRLVGLVTAGRPMYLVTELAARRSLKDCLRRDDVFLHADIHTLLNVCSQVRLTTRLPSSAYSAVFMDMPLGHGIPSLKVNKYI